ncbi:Shikimate dehydrogenase (NADP(+)) (SDH), partial [Durusdinium trenchii]
VLTASVGAYAYEREGAQLFDRVEGDYYAILGLPLLPVLDLLRREGVPGPITGRTRIAGVIGAPVRHSLSPLLMNRWIAAAGLDAAYVALPAQDDLDAAGFRALAQAGLAGLNVTLPFKQLALEAADRVTEAAQAARAANLLLFRDGRIVADNTDIDGARDALAAAGAGFAGRHVLVLGAGGVAQAICTAATRDGAARLTLCNRTPKRAAVLATRLEAARVQPWAQRHAAAAEADIIVNATSLGLDGQSSPIDDWQGVKPDTIVFDTIYTPAQRPFLAQARAAGLTIVDGLAMLIGQARPSFRQLFGADVPDSVDAAALLRGALDDDGV